MTCKECELWLADAVSSAQDAVSSPEMEAHLKVCMDCRAIAAELEANAEALHSMRSDPVPVEIRIGGRRGWIRVAGVAAAVVLAVGLAALFPRPVAITVSNGVQVAKVEAQHHPAPPNLAPPIPAPAVPETRVSETQRTAPQLARRARAVAREEPMLVQFLTPDPDVVIYWLVEPKEAKEGVL
jgi:hypothetical protein